MVDLVYRDRTEVLRRGLFQVQNKVGLGRGEETYHRAYVRWLEKEGIPFVSKKPHPLELYGQRVHTFYPDLVLWDCITVEMKSLPRHLRQEEHVQLFDYLKCRGDKLGVLANMGLARVCTERIVYDPPECVVAEDWSYWTGKIASDAREIGARLRGMVMDVIDAHGTGYGAEVTDKLLVRALHHHGTPYMRRPTCPSMFRGEKVGDDQLDCFVINGCIVLVVTALFDSNQFNISRGVSFLDSLDLEWGVAVNFGKTSVQIQGLHRPRAISTT